MIYNENLHKQYANPNNLSLEDLENKLKNIYGLYKDDWNTFIEMVEKFASDDFYHYHFIAKIFLNKKREKYNFRKLTQRNKSF